ncbi:hypothetical protein VNO80_16483 [Phaseolus coccineus]|uniref:Uncharacterized protein n=1 Tax=Phaseolus coccineus TaxID=3886 RepID=A0AAN9R069_PHACN
MKLCMSPPKISGVHHPKPGAIPDNNGEVATMVNFVLCWEPMVESARVTGSVVTTPESEPVSAKFPIFDQLAVEVEEEALS